MKRLLELFGFLSLVQGAGGVVHDLTDERYGWGLLRRFGLLESYELYVSIALIVLAIALFAVAESRKEG
ncbi:hypothetical protein GKQ77_14510 [Streptomyces sp. BG9H]|uniref:Uncharacterized protein n=1 Tax=Streptomyces anatolicus TaxID=2675858 RepID=A0ABS6YNU9_9ACTN|nr:hypothetical protein [Streptomyces anatolicus]MBW5422760.1 hypothetical protein [Streptomyces anatolicus]